MHSDRMMRLISIATCLLLAIVTQYVSAEDEVETSTDRCPFWRIKNDTYTKRYGDRCYRFVLDKDVTYNKAKGKCLGMLGELVVIKSAEINTFLTDSLINDYNFTGRAWIGLSDVIEEGTFTWSFGHKLGNYTNWAEGDEGFETVKHYVEDCVAIDAGSTPVPGKWRDFRCTTSSWTGFLLNEHLPYICQVRFDNYKKPPQ